MLTALIGSVVAVGCLVQAFIWNRSGLTLNKFFLLDGKLRLPGFVGAIVAANLSLGNFIVFIATWGYRFGFAGIVFFVLNLTMNFAGVAIFLRVFRPYIEDAGNNGTIHDYLSRKYGGDPRSVAATQIRLSASVVTVVCLGLAMMFELSLAVALLQPKTAFDAVSLFGALAAAIAIFTAYGGFRTLITSDIANALILSVGACCLVYLIWTLSSQAHLPAIVVSLSANDFANLGWPNMLSILVIGFGWMLVAMDQWQRTCATRSYNVTFKGMVFYWFILSAFAVVFAAWGAFDHNVMPAIAGHIVLSGANNPLLDISSLPLPGGIERFMTTLVVSGLVFAAFSTTNTFLNVCSHSLTTDMLMSTVSKKEIVELDQAQNRLYVGIARSVIVSLGAVIIALFFICTVAGLMKDPLSFFFIAYSVQFALLAPMVITAVPKDSCPGPRAVLLSIWLGFLVAICLGLSSWSASQGTGGSTFGLANGDWLTLTPVVTVAAGFIPLLVTVKWPTLFGRWRARTKVAGGGIA